MDEFTNHQLLLMQLRDDHCDGRSATLARRIGKDSTYVNRLFYPIGKKDGKGIGLEIMRVCTATFSLPPGFWEIKSKYVPQKKVKARGKVSRFLAAQPATEPPRVMEPQAEFQAWPFRAPTAWEYHNVLTPEDRAAIEGMAFALLNARADPSKQAAPAKYVATKGSPA